LQTRPYIMGIPSPPVAENPKFVTTALRIWNHDSDER
jgi:hypothetical protein